MNMQGIVGDGSPSSFHIDTYPIRARLASEILNYEAYPPSELRSVQRHPSLSFK